MLKRAGVRRADFKALHDAYAELRKQAFLSKLPDMTAGAAAAKGAGGFRKGVANALHYTVMNTGKVALGAGAAGLLGYGALKMLRRAKEGATGQGYSAPPQQGVY
jgi:hypothetical protein